MNSKYADTVWINADILTMSPMQPRVQSIGSCNGRIIFTGTNDDAKSFINRNTDVIDLKNKFVMPGLIDCHIHGLWGAARDLYEVYVGYNASVETLLNEVSKRRASLNANEWITGGPWRMNQREEMGDIPRLMLDAISETHPIALKDATLHSLWLNTHALELSGLTNQDPAIFGEQIERDASGRPNGIVHENACGPVRGFLKLTQAQMGNAVTYMRDYLHRMGITACKEAMASEADLKAYWDADIADALRLHLATHISRRSPILEATTPYDQILDWAERYSAPHIHTRYAKLFLDGVAPSLTAAFLDPYEVCSCCSDDGFDPDTQLRYTSEHLADEVTELDRLGFTVKMHAVGDRAVQAGLDAIQVARERNGDSGLLHEIGHTAFVANNDMKRFKQINAIAEVSPKLWYPNAITPGQIKVLGEARTHRCHPIRSLLEAEATVVYGSDWPAAAPDANPWPGLAGMLTRQHPTGLYEGSVGPDQAITLPQALPLFTTEAARSLSLHKHIGSLEVGKSTDFICLEESIFHLDPKSLAQMEVLSTVFEGQEQLL